MLFYVGKTRYLKTLRTMPAQINAILPARGTILSGYSVFVKITASQICCFYCVCFVNPCEILILCRRNQFIFRFYRILERCVQEALAGRPWQGLQEGSGKGGADGCGKASHDGCTSDPPEGKVGCCQGGSEQWAGAEKGQKCRL